MLRFVPQLTKSARTYKVLSRLLVRNEPQHGVVFLLISLGIEFLKYTFSF